MNSTQPSATDRTTSFRESPPYVVFHIQTPAGPLYQVNGGGFVTSHPAEATRHPVSPDRKTFRLEGVTEHNQSVYCSALLHITAVAHGRVELAWGNSRLLLSPESLVSQAGGLAWDKIKHCHRPGGPFGPNVRIEIDGPEERVALFNIEIHPPPGKSGFLYPAPPDWDSSPRSIMTHLGLLGFSAADRQPIDSQSTLWRRPLDGLDGEVRLITGSGSRIQSLNVEIDGQATCHVGGIGKSEPHGTFHSKLISLIASLEGSGRSADLPLLASVLFSQPCHSL